VVAFAGDSIVISNGTISTTCLALFSTKEYLAPIVFAPDADDAATNVALTIISFSLGKLAHTHFAIPSL
jgi:hypothetical protein